MSGVVGASHSKSKVIGRSPDTVLGWCHINGVGTIAVRDSYNFGAVTDSGTGTYDFYFGQTLLADEYMVLCTCAANNTVAINNKLATYVRVSVKKDDRSGYQDTGYCEVAILTN